MDINQTIIVLVVFIVLILILLLVFLFSKFNKKPNWKSELNLHLIAKQKSKPQNVNDAKLYLIEIDSLFDQFLKNIAPKGKTMSERLKESKKSFNKQEYNMIWESHKLRNILVHEPNNTIKFNEILDKANKMSNILKNHLNN